MDRKCQGHARPGCRFIFDRDRDMMTKADVQKKLELIQGKYGKNKATVAEGKSLDEIKASLGEPTDAPKKCKRHHAPGYINRSDLQGSLHDAVLTARKRQWPFPLALAPSARSTRVVRRAHAKRIVAERSSEMPDALCLHTLSLRMFLPASSGSSWRGLAREQGRLRSKRGCEAGVRTFLVHPAAADANRADQHFVHDDG